MMHCIYQELALVLGPNIEELRNLQVISRVAFVESTPIEVMDVVLSEANTMNLARIHVHFTGNAA